MLSNKMNNSRMFEASTDTKLFICLLILTSIILAHLFQFIWNLFKEIDKEIEEVTFTLKFKTRRKFKKYKNKWWKWITKANKKSKKISLTNIPEVEDDDEIYHNQWETAEMIYQALKEGNYLVTLIAKTQAGKTGTIKALFKLLNERDNMPYSNFFMITGMSDCDWKRQTKERLPELGNRIEHNNTIENLKKLIRNKRDLIIAIDETHIASKYDNEIGKFFRSLGLTEGEIKMKNIKIIQISATPGKSLFDAEWCWKTHKKILMKLPSNYISLTKLIENDRVIQARPLTCHHLKNDIIPNIILSKFSEPKYHFMRLPARGVNMINYKNICIQNGIKPLTYFQEDKTDIINIIEKKPDQHTIIFLKDKLRAAKTLFIKGKNIHKNIGLLYDRIGSDNNIVVQSLAGRGTGYYNLEESEILIGSDIPSLERYEDLYENNFEYLYMNPRNLKGFGLSGKDPTSRNNLLSETPNDFELHGFKKGYKSKSKTIEDLKLEFPKLNEEDIVLLTDRRPVFPDGDGKEEIEDADWYQGNNRYNQRYLKDGLTKIGKGGRKVSTYFSKKFGGKVHLNLHINRTIALNESHPFGRPGHYKDPRFIIGITTENNNIRFANSWMMVEYILPNNITNNITSNNITSFENLPSNKIYAYHSTEDEYLRWAPKRF